MKKYSVQSVMLLCALALTAGLLAEADEVRPSKARIEGSATLTSNVGMMAHIEQVVLPGSELVAGTKDSRTAPVVLRIDAVYPNGDGFRYDLTWSAYEAGTHDLAEYLARKDGTSTDDLPPLEVHATSTLPPDRVSPNAPESHPRTSVGGYRTLLWIAAVLWAAGLAGIIVSGRRKVVNQIQSEEETPRSRLEQIRSLLTRATQDGEFSAADKARLEGFIVGFWREHRHIQHLSAQDACARLRDDVEAGPLLNQLERWLYDPAQPGRTDVTALLSPLQKLVDGPES